MTTVLVVDDHRANRELITTLLGYRGHRTIEAGDGREALTLARRERPDLVICDILMPTMDGFEFVRELRADPDIAATEVIFYSAHYREREAQNLAQLCGVSRILVKPCAPEEILRTVDEALASERPPPRPPPAGGEFERTHARMLSDQLFDNVARLEYANERLTALIDVNTQLASERDPHRLLDKVCRGARDLIGARYAVLCVRDKNEGALPYCTVSGIDATLAGELPRPLPEGGRLADVANGGTPRRWLNPGGDPHAAGLPRGYPAAHALLACPIASLHSTYGWVCLANKVGGDAFTDDDEHLLSIYAAQVGRIYENGSLYVQVRRRVAELRESEMRFRQLAESIREVFFLTDPAATQFLYVSPAYEEIWGRSRESLYAAPRSWLDAVLPEDRERMLAAAGGRVVTDEFDVEFRIVRADASLRWIRARGYPIRDEAGTIYRIAGVADDITASKEAENRIRRLNRVHAVLSGINALIVRAREREELYREACRIAVDAGQFGLAWIGIIDRGSGRVVPVAAYGVGDDAVPMQAFAIDPSAREMHGLAGRAIHDGKPVVINDLGAAAGEMPDSAAVRRGFRGLALLPLPVGDGPGGVLALYASETGFFDAEEMKLLRELAGDIGFALDYIASEEKLDFLALHDPLTGLPNRSLLRERINQCVDAAGREKRRLALVVADIARFATINNTMGRAGGDELLEAVAARLIPEVPDPKLFGRPTSGAFAVVIPEVRHEDDIARYVEQWTRTVFGAPYRIADTELRVAARFGIAVFPGDGTDADTLLHNAEAALTRTKTTGEHYLFYTQHMTERVASQLLLENRLRRAFENGEFILHYQPKVDLARRAIQGVEALLRWQSPDGGIAMPGGFVPLLEETGMIVEVGAWVLRQAANDYRKWREHGLAAPRIAVNVSPIQLRHPAFVRLIDEILSVGAAGIEIELTESAVVETIDTSVAKLRALRELGLDIAIDDFGTGYSSLGYLAKLPVQALKIDRSFIATMVDQPEAMALVSMIITLAHSLRLKVVAEGVESEEQAKALRLQRCDEMQGFLVARPLPAAELAALISRRPVATPH